MSDHNALVDFKYSTWIGTALKGGGEILAGFETVGGEVLCLGMPSHVHDFDILNVTMGLGVGASVGVIGVAIFNARQLDVLNGKDVGKGDVSLNASLGGKWGDVAKVLSKYKLYAKFAKLSKLMKAKKIDPGQLTGLIEALMTLKKAASLDPSGKKPVFFTFPIPAAGIGLRLSINYTLQGKFELGRLRAFSS